MLTKQQWLGIETTFSVDGNNAFMTHKLIFSCLCVSIFLPTDVNAQLTNSRRTPVAIESLGGVAAVTPADVAWTTAYPANVRPLLTSWTKFNNACRGGPGRRVTEPNLGEWMSRVCSARDASAAMLRFNGYCYGREGESGVDQEWHACTKISYGYDYFAQ